MTIWILKGPGPEMAERYAACVGMEGGRFFAGMEGERCEPPGKNTHEEMEYIASQTTKDVDVVWVVTSAYHVERAYLTLMASLKKRGLTPVVHVWGVGTVTNLHLHGEAKKMSAIWAAGHALKWEDLG